MTLRFNQYGNLEGGILTDVTLEDIKTTLVSNFPNSETRPENYQLLIDFLSNLDKNIITRLWLDGSFCTKKENPKDIDILLFFKHSLETRDYINQIIDEANTKLDIYPIGDKDFIEKTRPIYTHMLHNEKYWMGQFGFDEDGNHKAIIELRMENLK